ncbi:MAG TPA: DNA ligase D [Steroidobacteraceae bacterium]|nr:DNA ligase D [Steroidobacteraceae bacterium]
MASKLAAFRAKRDFDQTPEPSGKRAVGVSTRRRYVIQKHDARRLHYDLRLELDGVFKSWAVTRGPSLDPADKRLAVEVEDHPLDYGDFEGTIPAGQYGGGTVQLWDRGYWEPLPGLDPREGLRRGQLKFSLEGERLHGEWALVRMRSEREGRENWLLIKHRDGAADARHSAELLREDRSVASGRTLSQIAAGRGRGPRPFMLAAGTRTRADAVWQSKDAKPAAVTRRPARPRGPAAAPMPEFIAPQLCKLVQRPPTSDSWVHEVKFDGYRLQLRVADGKAVLRTRKGLDWSARFPEIRQRAGSLPDCILDGEIVSLDAHGAPSFAALQAALSTQRTADLVYFAFDLLFLQGEDLRPLPLSERKQRLHGLLGDEARTLRYVPHFTEAADTVLKSACRMQLEGIVSKQLDAPYICGRGNGWTKSKCRAGQEVIIGGWTSEAGTQRSLLVGVHRDGRLAYAGRVGTGFGRDTSARLLSRLKAVAAKESPFSGAGAPRWQRDIHWVRPQLVAEIEFAGWTDSGMVRQAAFKGLREDKPAAEIGIERPVSPEQVVSPRKAVSLRKAVSSKPPAGPTPPANPEQAAGAGARIMGVTISQPDKPLWPDGGDGRPVTKLELARYMEAVGPRLIEHIAGRPCSLVRAPDGIAGPHFFQRHAMPGMSSLLDLVRVSGDRKPYVVINRVEGLIAAAQIAALELHPWNCAPGALEVPGRLVFDLDPAPDVEFDAVISGALELRERLAAVGLESFCKTTGGKGLHVVTPLARERNALDWAAAKTFAQALCAQMATDSPQRYLTTMAKKARTGRIFLDYLRNDRMATAVAPLSARARAGAPVSMPLTWPQVRRGLTPQRYTLRTALALLERSAAWQGYNDAERSLRAAVEQFTSGLPDRNRDRRHSREPQRRARAAVHSA